MSARVEELFARSSYAAPDTIVVATALTDLNYLTPQAIAEALSAHAELVFVHAITAKMAPSFATNFNANKADRDARLALEIASRQVRSHGLSCKVVVRHGAVRDVVDEQIQERAAGRLILGARSSAQAARGVGASANRLGSVSRQLLAHQWIPVSCISSQVTQAKEAQFAPRKILYPMVQDSHEAHQQSCKQGHPLVRDLSKYFRAKLIVLEGESGKNQAGEVMGTCLSGCPMGLWPQAERYTLPVVSAEAILRAAREHEVDWIVLDRATMFDPEPLMAEVEAVMAESRCPVLIAQHIRPIENHLVPLVARSTNRAALTLLS